MAKVLVTAFEPFDGLKSNSSALTLEKVRNQWDNTRCFAAELPVTFEDSWRALKQALVLHHPDRVVLLGQAESRQKISVEKLAINWVDARIPDNKGQQILDQAIVPQGPAAYFATLPVKSMVEASQSMGVPTELSLTAGSYVCNFVMYMLLHHLEGSKVQGGFVHLPLTLEQASEKSLGGGMDLEIMVKGVSAIIKSLSHD